MLPPPRLPLYYDIAKELSSVLPIESGSFGASQDCYRSATWAGEAGLSHATVEEGTIESQPRNVVQHDYHDHAHETSDDEINQIKPLTFAASGDSLKPPSRGGVTTPFPLKLHQMLDKIELDGFASVASWQPHGRCFVVHKQKEFVEHIMPTYFRQTKFASFLRQLNLYGFSRLTAGRDKGGYYHELFLRGKPFLCNRIVRMKVKGTGARMASNPESEPNFYAMDPVRSFTSAPLQERKQDPVRTAAASPSDGDKVLPDDSFAQRPNEDIRLAESKPFQCISSSSIAQVPPFTANGASSESSDAARVVSSSQGMPVGPIVAKEDVFRNCKLFGDDVEDDKLNLSDEEVVAFFAAFDIDVEAEKETIEDEVSFGFLLEKMVE